LETRIHKLIIKNLASTQNVESDQTLTKFSTLNRPVHCVALPLFHIAMDQSNNTSRKESKDTVFVKIIFVQDHLL
jgi:predicted transcriptional regulator